jgi:O-antigen/teichoic acid export membrane protein
VSTLEPPFEGLADLEFEAAQSRSAGHYLLRGSAWLSISTVVGALGGLLFWLVSAHLAPSRDVGQVAALYTGVLFVNFATNFGLNIAVARYARDRSTSSFVTYSWAVVLSGTTSVLGALVFFELAPARVVAPLRTLGMPVNVALLCAIAASVAVTTLVDVRLVGLRRWSWVFVRALAVSSLRIPLLWLEPLRDRALWIFLIAAGVPALSGVVGALALHRVRKGGTRFWPVPPGTRAALRYALNNYVPVLAEQAPLLALPLIVLVSVGLEANANFYIAWGITAFTFIIPTAIAQVFLVEGGRDGASLDDQTKLALCLSLVLMAGASLVAWLGHDLVTVVYGQSYERAARILPELVVAAIPWAITSIGLTRARIEHNTRAVFCIAATFAAAVLVPSAIWTPATGLTGAAHAWVFGNVVAACVAAVSLVSRTPRRAGGS